jgi:hypothetical protein
MSAFRAVNLGMAVLFLVAAALQYNDPDPEVWVPLYAGAAAACLLVARRPGTWPFPALVAGVALGWAAWLAPEVLPRFSLGDLVGTMTAANPAIELSREFLGLLIVAAWMVIVAAGAGLARRPR